MPRSHPQHRHAFALALLLATIGTLGAAGRAVAADRPHDDDARTVGTSGPEALAGAPAWLRPILLEEREADRRALASPFDRWLSASARARARREEAEAAGFESDALLGRDAEEVFPWTLASAPSPIADASRMMPASPASTWTYMGPVATYNTVNDNVSQPLKTFHANVTGFAVAPSNPNVLYAGTQMGVLNKSTDKGLHWTTLGEGDTRFRTNIKAIAVHPIDPNIVYVGNGLGILKSTDGGATWTLDLDYAPTGANTIALNPAKPETLLVAGNSLFAHSPSAGWQLGIGRFTYDVLFHPTNPNLVYAVIQNAAGDSVQFFKSTNGGNSFSIRRPGWLGHVNGDLGARIAVSPASPDRIYALVLTVEGARLLRSNDAGETWFTQAFNPVGTYATQCEPNFGPFTLENPQGYYDMAIAVSPTNADQLILGTSYMFRSLDGGVTFKSVSECVGQHVHPDAQEMVCIGGDSWIVTDGGVSLSTDFWATTTNWSSRTLNLRGTQMWGFGQGWNEDSFISGRNHNALGAWVEGYPAGMHLGFSSGEPVSGYINPVDHRRAYITAGGRVVLPATFGEPYQTSSLSKLPYEGGAAPGDEMDCGEQEWDPRYGKTYYIGRTDGLWRTDNDGASFTKVWAHSDPSAIEEHIEVSRTNPDVIYVTVLRPASGELWKTTDHGKTWTACANPPGLSDGQRILSTITMSGTDPNVLWWAFRNGPNGAKLFKTTDGGQTWTNLTTPTLDGVVLVNLFHQLGTQGGVYLVGQYGAVFYRNDLMPDWVPYNSGLSAHIANDMVMGGIQYPKKLLRLSTTDGVWQVGLYEDSGTTLVQPMVDASGVVGACDTLQFESYSVANGPATYHWTISPPPAYISDADVRNPRVVLGTAGSHAVTLAITDLNGTTTRTIRNFLTTTGVQYADSVVASSSEYTLTGAPAWYAVRATGLPDTYPDYGDIESAWASLNADDQQEFLDLHFATPQHIDFVALYETFNPGALTRVSVKNPANGQFQQVWAAPAAPAPEQSRVFVARFSDPGFNVNDVRLDFDSPAVPGWNEIDAVAIGLENCAAALVGVPDVPAPVARSGIDFVGPNPSSGTAVIAYSLARGGWVRADVFDLQGHRVARLADRMFLPGRHELRWDGRDTRGQIVASGVYYVRVQGPEGASSAKVVRLR